jgi:hypothetical protein
MKTAIMRGPINSKLVPFICSSLNDAVSKTDYTATNDLGWMWKEVLYCHFPGSTEKRHE